MRKLLVFGALALGHGIDAAFGNDEDLAQPRPSVNYDIKTFKPLAMRCDASELCDAASDLKHWNHVQDAERYKGKWAVEDHPWIKGNKQLVMKDEMAFYGLSREVTPWKPADGKPLSFSMTARYSDDHNCGGAYVKLYHMTNKAHDLDGEKPYSIMFGPDRCGVATRKVHFILQYNDSTGKRVEEHLAANLDLPADIRKTHQYSFVIMPSGNVEIALDGVVVQEGALKALTTPGWKSPETIDDPEDEAPEDWTPPARMIPDPTATKPEDWDNDEPETIEDVDAVQPEDWLEDEPELIPNAAAVKPENWDDAEDGAWQRPLMKNPKCITASGCGPWTRPIVPNPNHRGEWVPPMIPNPAYTEKYPTRQIPHPAPYDIADPFTKIEPFDALGIEIWTVQAGTVLDNFMLSTEPDRMREWSRQAFEQIKAVEDENYKRALEGSEESAGSKKDADPHHYVKFGAGVLMAGVVLTVAIRKLLAKSFRQSDLPEKSGEGEPTNGQPQESKENDSKPSGSKVTESAAETGGKKPEEGDTEPSAGETKPSKRAANLS